MDIMQSVLGGDAPAPTEIPSKPRDSTGKLVRLFLAMSLLFLLVNLATGTRSPRLWEDEVLFTDPAINLVTGHGFTSGAWAFENRHQLFADNCPLFSLLMAGWLRVVGIGMLRMRALNYVLTVLTAGFTVMASYRLRILRGKFDLALLLAMLYCAYGMTFSYRSARYDVLGMLWCSILFFLHSVKNIWLRRTLMVVVAMLLPDTGLQLPVFAAISSIFLLMLLRWCIFLDLCFIGIGISIGAAVFFAFLQSQKVLSAFLNATVFNIRGAERARERIHLLETCVIKHPPTVILLIAILIVLLGFRASRGVEFRKLIQGCLLFGILMPLGMAIAGWFPHYYTWMSFIPTAICFCGVLARAARQATRSRAPIYVLATGAILACYGLPGHVALAVWGWKQNDPARLDDFIASVGRTNDTIYCSYQAYLGCKAVTPNVLSGEYLTAMTAREKREVDLIVVGVDVAKKVMLDLGGNWRLVGTYFPPLPWGIHRQPTGPGYYLQSAYRRVDNGTRR